jgi:mannitol-1-/sugar-/sorbitol-6-phosphatase
LPSVETDCVSITTKALLIDLDGTLVDSTVAIEEAWRWAADQLSIPFTKIAPYIHGIPADQALELAVPTLDEAEKRRLSSEILTRQADSSADVPPMPGAVQFLNSLPIGSWAVVTSGSVRLAESSIHKAGLPEPPILITADDVQTGKPDPEPFIRAMGVLDVSADECIVIEDSPHGIASGVAAGIRVLAVGTTFRPQLLDGASWLIPNLEKIEITVEPDHIRLSWRASPTGDTTRHRVDRRKGMVGRQSRS